MRDWEGAEKHSADDAEDDGVGPNSESEGANGGQYIARTLACGAKCKLDILQNSFGPAILDGPRCRPLTIAPELFVAQGDYGIDAQGAVGGNVTSD